MKKARAFYFSGALTLAVVLVMGLFAILFQNCSGSANFSGQQPMSLDLGNGWAYDGIIYSSLEACGDMNSRAQISLLADGRFVLLKENCSILSQPVVLAASEVQFNVNQPNEIIYLGRIFRTQVAPTSSPTPTPTAQPSPSPTPDTMSIAVLRLRKSDGDYFFTTSAAEAQNAVNSSGYVAQGIGFYVFANPSPTRYSMYRCRRTSGSHFLSIGANCEGSIFEGLIGYTESSQKSYATRVLTRCFFVASGHHITTTNAAADCSDIDVNNEGPQGYVQ